MGNFSRMVEQNCESVAPKRRKNATHGVEVAEKVDVLLTRELKTLMHSRAVTAELKLCAPQNRSFPDP